MFANEAHATKLREVLSELGCQLTDADSLAVISTIKQRPSAKPYPGKLNDTHHLAEQYVDELLEGVSALDYTKFTRRFEEQYRVLLTEREFKRDVSDIHNEFGSYIRRDFMGCMSGFHRPDIDRYPNEVRYLWRMFFEKNEVLLMVNIYQKNGIHFISEANSI